MAASPLLDTNSAPKDDDVPRVLIACSNVSHSVQVSVGFCKAQPRQILTSVSCAFQPGSLTALMGPSGAGKTTLLSLLRSGRPSSGEVTLNGQPHGRSRGLIRTIPQDDVLLAGLTAAEALHFAAQLSLRRAACKARVAAVLAQLSLGPELAHTKIGSVHSRGLSGGQRKRVSIGIELLADPAVLLVDEPTSGLDAKMAQDVMAMLKSLSLAGRIALLPTAPLTRSRTLPLTRTRAPPLALTRALTLAPTTFQAAPSSPRSTSRPTASSASSTIWLGLGLGCTLTLTLTLTPTPTPTLTLTLTLTRCCSRTAGSPTVAAPPRRRATLPRTASRPQCMRIPRSI